MKNIFKILSILALLIVTLSCRNDDVPEDIHEHEEIEKMVIQLVNKNDATDTQTIQYIGGISDQAIQLQEGVTYVVSLDFQTKHDDHYHSSNEELLEEKDEHFITYEFGNAEVLINRTEISETRGDGSKLGLVTEWKVSKVNGDAKANIKLVHLPVSVQQDFPSAENQQGKTSGGETDVNAFINMSKK